VISERVHGRWKSSAVDQMPNEKTALPMNTALEKTQRNRPSALNGGRARGEHGGSGCGDAVPQLDPLVDHVGAAEFVAEGIAGRQQAGDLRRGLEIATDVLRLLVPGLTRRDGSSHVVVPRMKSPSSGRRPGRIHSMRRLGVTGEVCRRSVKRRNGVRASALRWISRIEESKSSTHA